VICPPLSQSQTRLPLQLKKLLKSQVVYSWLSLHQIFQFTKHWSTAADYIQIQASLPCYPDPVWRSRCGRIRPLGIFTVTSTKSLTNASVSAGQIPIVPVKYWTDIKAIHGWHDGSSPPVSAYAFTDFKSQGQTIDSQSAVPAGHFRRVFQWRWNDLNIRVC